MTLLDRTVAALHTSHDALSDRAQRASDEDLARRSGASEWSVADVLSHLGSSAEIGLATLRSALSGEAAPDQEFNQVVWGRWNAATPREQADGFVTHNAALLAGYDALDDTARATLAIQLSFLPTPLPLVSLLGMRLNEIAAHGWDVDVAFDRDATIRGDAADVLLEHLDGGLGFMVRFTGKADRLGRRAEVAIGATGHSILIDEVVSVIATNSPDATFDGPAEAALRLLAGRLAPEHTQSGVAVIGSVTLDNLRQVFPGY
jgi:uncharacterized protein (TIGR03083 family)